MPKQCSTFPCFFQLHCPMKSMTKVSSKLNHIILFIDHFSITIFHQPWILTWWLAGPKNNSFLAKGIEDSLWCLRYSYFLMFCRLWFDELVGFWDSCHNSPSWEQVSNFTLNSCITDTWKQDCGTACSLSLLCTVVVL